MTKYQIIAKVMLTTLGVYAVLGFISVLQHGLYSHLSLWLSALQAFLVLATVFLVGMWLIFKNDSFACMIAGNENGWEEFDRISYLIKSFRIGFAILGLIFLSSWGNISGLARNLHAFSFGNIHLWVSNVIETKTLTGGMFGFQEIAVHTFALFKLAAAIYLLLGGVHIVRWHLRNSCFDQKNEELTNE